MPDGKIDAQRADEQWERNTQEKVPPVTAPKRAAPRPVERPADEPPSHPEAPGIGGLEYAKARAIREQYLARLAKIEFEERSGKLVNRDEVQVAAFNRFRAFRDGMLNIADRISAVVAAEGDPIKVHDLLTTEIRRALTEFVDAAANNG